MLCTARFGEEATLSASLVLLALANRVSSSFFSAAAAAAVSLPMQPLLAAALELAFLLLLSCPGAMTSKGKGARPETMSSTCSGLRSALYSAILSRMSGHFCTLRWEVCLLLVLPLPSQPGVGHRDSASLLSVRPEGVDIVECGDCDVADDRKILRQGPRLNIDIFIVYRECWQFFGQQF